MTDTIRIDWTWTEEDHVRALKTHQKFGRYERRLRILLLATGALLAVYWLLFERDAWTIALTAAYAVVAVFVIGRVVILPFWARKVYRQQKALHRPFTFELDATALRTTQEDGGQWRLAWADCHRWVEGPEDFLVYQSDALFHLIPKRLLDEEQIIRVRGFLAAGAPKR